MRRVTVEKPSFPPVNTEKGLIPKDNLEWQVFCGDEDHWRVGLYSPQYKSRAQIEELEQHTCPELFMLVSGNITLVVAKDGHIEEMPLEPMRPVLVTQPHSGFCPHGPFTGQAIVVERDQFETVYRTPLQWCDETAAR